MPALILYWKQGLMAILAVVIAVLWLTVKGQRHEIAGLEQEAKACRTVNAADAATLATMTAKVGQLETLTREQEAALTQKEGEISQTEAELNKQRAAIRTAVIPKKCEEGGEWFIEQFSH